MKPQSGLRRRYLRAANQIKKGEPDIVLTHKQLAYRLEVPLPTVRNYLYRHPKFRDTLGVPRHFSCCREEDYVQAIHEVLATGATNVRCQDVAARLGKDTSSVARFVRERPGLQKLMNLRLRPRRQTYHGKDIDTEYFDDNVLRVVLGTLTARQYVQKWDYHKLGFQVRNKSRPAHLPHRNQVAQYLKSLS